LDNTDKDIFSQELPLNFAIQVEKLHTKLRTVPSFY